MSDTETAVSRLYLKEARFWLAANVARIEHCLGQLSEEQLWWRPHKSMNSVANLVLHLSGNIRQRIVSTVGGEPDVRDRPSEFSERGPIAKAELLGRLQQVAAEADSILARLDADGLVEPRRYQGLNRVFDGTALSTVLHCLVHLGGHAQEIIHMTRIQLGEEYQFQMTPSPTDDSGQETN